MAPYIAIKHAVNGMVKMVVGVAHQVRVNGMAQGPIDNEWLVNRTILPDDLML